MLDPDISTAAALAHLHTNEHDAHALDRRRFLKLVGMGVGAGAAIGANGGLLNSVTGNALTSLFGDPSTWALGPVSPTDGILVVIGMYGGNDGLNTVVPIADGNYYTQHGALAIPGNQTLPLDGGAGLHPSLTHLKDFWDRSQLAIVEGVGYERPDLSHFNSMKFWMSARPGELSSSGWIGRWLDGYLGGGKDLYAAAEVGGTVPLQLVGDAQRGTAVPTDRPWVGIGQSSDDHNIYRAMRRMGGGGDGPWADAVAAAFGDHLTMTAQLAPIVPEVPAGTRTDGIQTKLEVAARLINANLGFRVLTAGWNDFDSHSLQPNMHPVRMAELNEAVGRFFEVLDPTWASRVTLMTFSEFGRTSWANAGNGTDHGSAAPHFVFGQNVRGGWYGGRPSLAGLGRWERMQHTVDFRSYFASVIDGWLGGGSSDVLGGNFENLDLFRQAPGYLSNGQIDALPVVVSTPAMLTPVTPFRAVDTRIGLGAPAAKLGPGATIPVQITGTGSGAVPTGDVTAVVANLTVTEQTSPMYLTAYPGGETRPVTSSVNAVPGRAVPNLVVMQLGAGGTIDVFNSHGESHVIVDVFGYLSAGTGALFTGVTPERLFDTRTGAGVRPGKLADRERVTIPVAGFAGVPAGATAVVMNLTAAETESPGYLRLTPSGNEPAHTSNVNFGPGEAVPNLVICQLGSDGNLLLDCVGSGQHVIGDVFGYFGPSGGRLRTILPARALDSRSGLGNAIHKIGPDYAVQLPVRGMGRVGSDATAVVANITGTNVAGATYITVWPGENPRPGTSNLNLLPGQTLANLTICQLGPDGTIMLTSPKAECDVIVDIVGFFTA